MKSKHKQKSKSHTSRLRATSRVKEERVRSHRKAERIITSASLPTWSWARLRGISDKLTYSLGSHCSDYILGLICLKLYNRRTQAVPVRATLYNIERCSYRKIGIVYAKQSEYQQFRMQALSQRISLSHLLDISLRLYLNMAARIYLLNFLGINLKTKWKKILRFFCNYFKISDQEPHRDSRKKPDG